MKVHCPNKNSTVFKKLSEQYPEDEVYRIYNAAQGVPVLISTILKAESNFSEDAFNELKTKLELPEPNEKMVEAFKNASTFLSEHNTVTFNTDEVQYRWQKLQNNIEANTQVIDAESFGNTLFPVFTQEAEYVINNREYFTEPSLEADQPFHPDSSETKKYIDEELGFKATDEHYQKAGHELLDAFSVIANVETIELSDVDFTKMFGESNLGASLIINQRPTVVLNKEKMNKDTRLHELLHFPIAQMSVENKELFDRLVEKAKKHLPDLWASVNTIYNGVTDSVENEFLVRALVNETFQKSKETYGYFRKAWNWIVDKWQRFFGIPVPDINSPLSAWGPHLLASELNVGMIEPLMTQPSFEKKLNKMEVLTEQLVKNLTYLQNDYVRKANTAETLTLATDYQTKAKEIEKVLSEIQKEEVNVINSILEITLSKFEEVKTDLELLDRHTNVKELRDETIVTDGLIKDAMFRIKNALYTLDLFTPFEAVLEPYLRSLSTGEEKTTYTKSLEELIGSKSVVAKKARNLGIRYLGEYLSRVTARDGKQRATSEEYENMLQVASNDLGILQTSLETARLSDDKLLQSLHEMVGVEQTKVKQQSLRGLKKLEKILNEISPSKLYGLYQTFIKDVVTEKGITKALIQEYDEHTYFKDKFEQKQMRNEKIKELAKQLEDQKITSITYKQEVKKAYRQFSNWVVENARISENAKEVIEHHQNNFNWWNYNISNYETDFGIVVNLKNHAGIFVPTTVYLNPHSSLLKGGKKYLEPDYNKVKDNPLYQELVKILKDSNSLLRRKDTERNLLVVPQFTQSIGEGFSKGVLKGINQIIGDTFSINKNEELVIEENKVREEGMTVGNKTRYYINPRGIFLLKDQNKLSLDLGYTVSKFYVEALNTKAMRGIESTMLVAQNLIDTRTDNNNGKNAAASKKMYNALLLSEVYSVKQDDADTKLAKVLGVISKFNIFLKLGFNAFSAIGNLAGGNKALLTEVMLTDRYKDVSQTKVLQEKLKWQVRNGGLATNFSDTSHNKLYNAVRLYDADRTYTQYVSKYKSLIPKIGDIVSDLPYMGLSIAERDLLERNVITNLMAKKLKLKDGTETNAWDALADDGEYPEGILGIDGKPFTERGIFRLSEDIKSLHALTQGIYSSHDPVDAQRKILGRLMMGFRRFYYEGVKIRIGRDLTNSEGAYYSKPYTEQMVEGYYRTAWRMAFNYLSRVFNEHDFSFRTNTIKPEEKQNLIKIGIELATFIGFTLGASAIIGDDDDDENTNLDYVLATMMHRVASEAIVGTDMLGLLSGDRVYAAPILSTFADLFKLGKETMRYTFADEDGIAPDGSSIYYQRDTNKNEKGDLKLTARFEKLVPILSTLNNLVYAKDQYEAVNAPR
jgi:hypothetical protein